MDQKNPLLNVIARAPFEVYYEGTAQVISAKNSIGPFDVLPGHADFFSVLEPCQVVIDSGKEPLVVFHINAGIITARDNEVHLFVNM